MLLCFTGPLLTYQYAAASCSRRFFGSGAGGTDGLPPRGRATAQAARSVGRSLAAGTVIADERQSDTTALQILMSTRVCGSPAVDGYAHVKPECMVASPTAAWWRQFKPRPDDLNIHIERHSDYDGVAVGWGIGNTKETIEECAEACRQHVPQNDGAQGGAPPACARPRRTALKRLRKCPL